MPQNSDENIVIKALEVFGKLQRGELSVIAVSKSFYSNYERFVISYKSEKRRVFARDFDSGVKEVETLLKAEGVFDATAAKKGEITVECHVKVSELLNTECWRTRTYLMIINDNHAFLSKKDSQTIGFGSNYAVAFRLDNVASGFCNYSNTFHYNLKKFPTFVSLCRDIVIKSMICNKTSESELQSCLRRLSIVGNKLGRVQQKAVKYDSYCIVFVSFFI